MDGRRFAAFAKILRADMSRRRALGRAGGALAAGWAASLRPVQAAQDATPMAGTPAAGLPPGVALTPLTGVAVTDMPPAPVMVNLTRVTLEPGADIPVPTSPYPSLAYVEMGTLICPGNSPRFVIAADGTSRQVGAEDVTVNTGETIYVPANVGDGARNDGAERLIVLLVEFPPAQEAATPTP